MSQVKAAQALRTDYRKQSAKQKRSDPEVSAAHDSAIKGLQKERDQKCEGVKAALKREGQDKAAPRGAPPTVYDMMNSAAAFQPMIGGIPARDLVMLDAATTGGAKGEAMAHVRDMHTLLADAQAAHEVAQAELKAASAAGKGNATDAAKERMTMATAAAQESAPPWWLVHCSPVRACYGRPPMHVHQRALATNLALWRHSIPNSSNRFKSRCAGELALWQFSTEWEEVLEDINTEHNIVVIVGKGEKKGAALEFGRPALKLQLIKSTQLMKLLNHGLGGVQHHSLLEVRSDAEFNAHSACACMQCIHNGVKR